MSKKNRKHKKDGVAKGLDKMIQCPSCRGYSYPLQFSDPKNEVEEKAVICGSCKIDIRPFITAMELWEKEEANRQAEAIANQDVINMGETL